VRHKARPHDETIIDEAIVTSADEHSTPGRPRASERPVYVISVAAELVGLHPQTLRNYDRIGLVSPGRTDGGGRRYSARDVELLREIHELIAAGIGVEGVRRILDLENQIAAMRERIAELHEELEAATRALAAAMAPNLPAVRGSTTVIPYTPARRRR
jgi:MerR family transcriptional regulator/heat shock protein HspR